MRSENPLATIRVGAPVAVLFALAAVAFRPSLAGAQQIYGTPGSPASTMSIEGSQLPAPPQKFGGRLVRS